MVLGVSLTPPFYQCAPLNNTFGNSEEIHSHDRVGKESRNIPAHREPAEPLQVGIRGRYMLGLGSE
jgi:hypothetical protein